jgi:hypothetical protein
MSLPQVPKALEVHPKLQEALLIAWLYDAQMLGFKESRDLLELVVDGFKTIRDKELDAYQTMLEQSGDEEKVLGDEIPDLPDE